MIGDSGVGKTNLVSRYTKGSFNESSQATVGCEYTQHTIKSHDGKVLRSQIWDTAGQERYRAITQTYYRSAVGACLVFDITEKASFDSCKDWISSLR